MGKLIHKGYYTEMLRQLKTPAIISACILMVWHISTFLIQLLMNSGMNGMYIPTASSMATNPMYYAYVMGLVFTFIGFSWLNKRSYSDFYHALPVSRTAIYFSTVAAILTVMFATIIATGILNALLYLVFGLPFNYLLYACVIVNALIASITIVGAVSIACAFSGTRFVNLIASVVILFMPRIMLTIFGALVGVCGDSVLDVKSICWLFDPGYNIAGTSLYGQVLSLLGLSISYTNVVAMLYNLIYAALLVFIGWRVFLKRRSEDAGMPTTNKLFQGAVRCGVGLPLLLILAGLMVGLDYSVDVIPIVLLVVFSFIFYCLYELISTKSMKKVVKAMPGFLICIGICLLYMFLPRLVARAELSIRPEADQIKGFSLAQEDDAYSDLIGSLLGDTFGSSTDPEISKVLFTDARARQIVSDACKSTSEQAVKYYDSDYFYSGNSMKLRIDRKHGKTIVRDIHFTDKQWDELSEIISENEDYRKAMSDFPDLDTIYCSVGALDNKQARQIAESYKEEFSALTVEQKMQLRSDTRYNSIIDTFEGMYGYGYGSDAMGTLYICGCRGVENYGRAYLINELTPKTEQLFIKLNNDDLYEKGMRYVHEMYEKAGEYEKDPNDDVDYYWIDIGSCDGQSSMGFSLGMIYNDYVDYDGDPYPERELYKEALQILQRGSRSDTKENTVQVSCAEMGYKGYFYVGLSQNDYDRLIEIMDRVNGRYDWALDETYYD